MFYISCYVPVSRLVFDETVRHDTPSAKKTCPKCHTGYERYDGANRKVWVNGLREMDTERYSDPVTSECCMECVRQWMVDHPEVMRDFLDDKGVIDEVVAEYFGLGDTMYPNYPLCMAFVDGMIQKDPDSIRDALREVLSDYSDRELADFVFGK